MPVAFDAVSSTKGAAVTSLSWTHTPVGTPSAVAILTQSADNNTSHTISSVTYGGVACVQEITARRTANYATVWGLANPPAGPVTVQVNFSEALHVALAEAVSVTGSDTSQCFSANASNNVFSTSLSAVVSGAGNGDLVVDSLAAAGTATPTVGAGQTSRFGDSQTGAASVYGAVSTEPATGSTTMSWGSGGGNRNMALAAASFKVAAGAGPSPFQRIVGNRSALAGPGGLAA